MDIATLRRLLRKLQDRAVATVSRAAGQSTRRRQTLTTGTPQRLSRGSIPGLRQVLGFGGWKKRANLEEGGLQAFRLLAEARVEKSQASAQVGTVLRVKGKKWMWIQEGL